MFIRLHLAFLLFLLSRLSNSSKIGSVLPSIIKEDLGTHLTLPSEYSIKTWTQSFFVASEKRVSFLIILFTLIVSSSFELAFELAFKSLDMALRCLCRYLTFSTQFRIRSEVRTCVSTPMWFFYIFILLFRRSNFIGFKACFELIDAKSFSFDSQLQDTYS